ncbi:lactonase family protein [Thermomonas sp.]|uniref:lactonase family protein n=1 Tax=Thermomonas sp. TaxID=1971895 RepID=UPI0035B053C5
MFALACAIGLPGMPRAQSQSLDLLVGSYTDGDSAGLYLYAFDAGTGRIAAQPKQALRVHNPSWLVVAPDQRNVYAVNENGPGNADPVGRVTRFSLSSTHVLEEQERVTSLSDHPTHASLSADARHLFVANYSGDAQPGGLLTVLPVDAQGKLGNATQVQSYQASNADPARQASSHVHAATVSPDGRHVLVADLGGDRVYVYRYAPGQDAERPLHAAKPAHVQFPAGSGPRHVAFSADGRHAYVTLEMTGQVVELDFDDGAARLRRIVDLAPVGFTGAHGAGAIHLSADGRFLYAVNRGDDHHIVVFSVGDDGALSLLQRRPTEAASTREFAISPDGRFLLLAIQGANAIAVLRRDPDSGLLGETVQTLALPRPSYLQFLRPH